MESKYLVKGSYQGMDINKVIRAYSDKQAKLKVAISYGFSGKELKKFLNSPDVRVIRKP